MRLIDADKIRYRDMSDGQVNGGVWYTFIEDIQKQPTVNAIPTEWIRKWHGIDDIRDCDMREYVKCTMLYMIKDWEKEE